MSVPFTIVLDPTAIAPDRTQLDINNGAIRTGSIDWGDAEVTAFETQEGDYGNGVAAIQLPNRTITIQLGLGMDDGAGGVSQEQARTKLQQKVGLLQREGGQVLRQRTAAGPAMYADIEKATLTPNDVTGETGDVELWTLVLETLPDFYGDEITLDSITATGVCDGVLKLSGTNAAVEGDYPARCRIVVTDTSGHDQLGAIWGLRSRHYDSATTAALTYEAEALTPLNGAATAALTGASGSGNNVVKLTIPTSAVWVPMLATNLLAGTKLTHRGSYRVWARAYSSAATPQLRLAWGAGSLSVPVTNDALTLPGAGGFYLIDLGSVRLDAPAAGANAWIGVIQAMGNSGDDVQIDKVYMQPLDEAAGRLSSVSVPSASVISQTEPAGAGADNAGVGSHVWLTPGNITVNGDSNWAIAQDTTVGDTTHYLVASGFGFAIPGGATIKGIEATAYKRVAGGCVDANVYIVKGGTIETAVNKAAAGQWSHVPVLPVAYGGSTDLWGQTWTPSDINSSSFGIALAALATNPSSFLGTASPDVDYIEMTVYYTASSGLTIAQDAVIYADQAAELRTEEMSRTQDGTVYGPITVQIGDLPRLPPSGIENRAVELLVKPSRGDLDALGDAGLDGFTARVVYRPCWLARP